MCSVIFPDEMNQAQVEKLALMNNAEIQKRIGCKTPQEQKDIKALIRKCRNRESSKRNRLRKQEAKDFLQRIVARTKKILNDKTACDREKMVALYKLYGVAQPDFGDIFAYCSTEVGTFIDV